MKDYTEELALTVAGLIDKVSKLENKVAKLKKENKSIGLIKKLKLDKEGKYLLLIPHDIFSMDDGNRFAVALKDLGFDCIVAVVPKTTGIKLVEKEQEKFTEDLSGEEVIGQ